MPQPKVVDLKAFTFRESINKIDIDPEGWDDEDVDFHIGTFTTFDIGCAVDLSEN